MGWALELASNAAASAWTDISDLVDRANVRIGGEIGNGSAGTGFGADFADDAAAYTVPSRRAMRYTIGPTVAGRGRVATKDLGRGLMPQGDARQFGIAFTDGNTHLQGIPVHGWVRPAETDVARILAMAAAFLAGSPRASTNLTTTLVSADDPVMLEAHTYDVTNPAGVVADVRRVSGKAFFVTVDDDIFYDAEDSANYAATISVTDDGADEETSFSPIWRGPAGTQDGSELYGGLGLVYSDPPLYIEASDPAVEAAHDYWREIVNSTATTTEQATVELDSLLAERKIEEDRFRFGIQIRESQDPASLIKYGQLISFRAAAAGVLSPITIRIRRLVWEEVGPGTWIAWVEDAKLVGRLGRGTRVSPSAAPTMPGLIVPFVSDPDKNFWGFRGSWDPRLGAEPGWVYDGGADCVAHVYDSADHMESFTTAGAVLVEPGCQGLGDVFRVGSRSQPTDPGYATYKNQVTDRIFYDFGSVGYSGMLHLNVWKITDSALPPTTAHLRVRNYGWTGTPGLAIDLPDGLEYPIEFSGPVFTTSGYRYWSAALAIPVAGFRQIVLDSLDYWYTDGPFFVGINAPAMAAANAAPPAGHPTTLIGAGPSDGVTTDYTSMSPYRPGSLEVYVGGLPWTSDGYVETDPAAGDFTFTQTPIAGTNPEDNLIEYRYVTA